MCNGCYLATFHLELDNAVVKKWPNLQKKMEGVCFLFCFQTVKSSTMAPPLQGRLYLRFLAAKIKRERQKQGKYNGYS